MDILVLLGGFTVLCALGVPVAYALGLGALLGALWADIPLEAVMLRISDGTDDFVLLAIPFFVLAGAIMAEGGMAARLVMLAKVFVGFIRGGMAVVNVLASTLFGCISGSSVADTSAIGSVMIPQMVKQGYSRVFATNVTICGSVQALLIPPSHNAVIYSVAAGGTILGAGLFLAGGVPGFLFGLCLVGLVLWGAHKRDMPKSQPIPPKVTLFFLAISENKYVFLMLVNILLLLLGTFMDLAPMLLICTPIFLPVIAKLGIDPVHFGMIMILNLGIGLITPPVGPTLFVGCAIGKVTMEQVSKELWPFYGAMCTALLLVTYIPALSLWLPRLLLH